MNDSAQRVVTFLLTTPFFAVLSTEELSEVAEGFEIVEVPEDHILFHEGDYGDAWYVVYEGQLAVQKDMPQGPSHELARLDPGDCFGEMALIDGSPRGATITAACRSLLLRFPRDRFQEQLESGSLSAYKILHQMARVLCQRQRELTLILSEIVDDPAPSSVELMSQTLWSGELEHRPQGLE